MRTSPMARRIAVAAACAVTGLVATGPASAAATIPKAHFNSSAALQDGGHQVVVTGSIYCDGETFLWVKVTLTQGSTKGVGKWGRHGCTHIPNPGLTPFSIVVNAPGSSTFHDGMAGAVGELRMAAALLPPSKPGPAMRFTGTLKLTGG